MVPSLKIHCYSLHTAVAEKYKLDVFINIYTKGKKLQVLDLLGYSDISRLRYAKDNTGRKLKEV